AAPGRRGRGAVHRLLPGLRRVRPDRARPRLDRADLERLVRRLRGDAEPAPQARPGHRARLHAGADQLAGGAELRRGELARRRPVPRADGQAQSTSSRGAARRQACARAPELPQPGRLRQRQGDRRGAAPRRTESDTRPLPRGAGVAQELRPRDRRAPHLRPGAAPAAGQRVLHQCGERTVGPHHGLGGRGEGMNKQRALRFGLLTKIILFLAVTLVPLAAITWWISVRALTTNLTEEFTSKGTAIARSLASSGVDLLLTRDASTVQGIVDQFGAINGVKYVMVYDPHKTLVAHTFSPLVPAGIVEKNLVPGEAPQQMREIAYPDPVTGAIQQIIDIGVPVLAGQLGTVRVGMDRSVITAAAARAGQYLLLVFIGVALPDVLGSVVDAINVMVEELATLIDGVREAAHQVLTGATEMIGAMEATAGGAQTQSREVVGVSDAMEALTRSMRRVAEDAEASAS